MQKLWVPLDRIVSIGKNIVDCKPHIVSSPYQSSADFRHARSRTIGDFEVNEHILKQVLKTQILHRSSFACAVLEDGPERP